MRMRKPGGSDRLAVAAAHAWRLRGRPESTAGLRLLEAPLAGRPTVQPSWIVRARELGLIDLPRLLLKFSAAAKMCFPGYGTLCRMVRRTTSVQLRGGFLGQPWPAW